MLQCDLYILHNQVQFQRLAFKTKWEDISLTTQFYRELKDSVKDDIMKAE